jgi:hypothetical protein
MIEIVDCEQNSEAWFTARLGVVTASEFGSVIAKGEGKMRASLMRKLATEIITGERGESFTTAAMERGHAMEDEARKFYSFMNDVEPQQVGFIRNGRKGGSPDSLIGNNGLLEIKTMRGDLLIEVLLKDEFPSVHKAQCQGNLLVAERDFIDISVYWPKFPPFIKRAYRDEAYLKTLDDEIERFNDDLDALVEKIKAYGVAA